MLKEKILSFAHSVYRGIDRRSGGVLGVMSHALHSFNRARGTEAAASIAYYAVFSILPLLLLIVSAVGVFMVKAEAPSQVIEFISGLAPFTRKFLEDNLLQILVERGTGGAIGVIALFWSASGIFITISRNINRAWPESREIGLFRGRLIAVAIVILLIILMVLLLLAIAIFRLLPFFGIIIVNDSSPASSLFWRIVYFWLPWILTFIVFFAMYRWLPGRKVRNRDAAWGALATTAAWQLITLFFGWYLNSGFARFEAIYGALGTSVALLTWIYLSAFITIFGAHISAAVSHFYTQKTLKNSERQEADLWK